MTKRTQFATGRCVNGHDVTQPGSTWLRRDGYSYCKECKRLSKKYAACRQKPSDVSDYTSDRLLDLAVLRESALPWERPLVDAWIEGVRRKATRATVRPSP